MKTSHAFIAGIVVVFGLWLLMDKAAEVVHGPDPTPNVTPDGDERGPRPRLWKYITKAVAEWGFDNVFRGKQAPEEPEPVRSLAEANLYQTMPVIPPSEFLAREGEPLEHSEGW